MLIMLRIDQRVIELQSPQDEEKDVFASEVKK